MYGNPGSVSQNSDETWPGGWFTCQKPLHRCLAMNDIGWYTTVLCF